MYKNRKLFNKKHYLIGGILALDGKDGKELWRLWTDHEIFSLTCQADIDGDQAWIRLKIVS